MLAVYDLSDIVTAPIEQCLYCLRCFEDVTTVWVIRANSKYKIPIIIVLESFKK